MSLFLFGRRQCTKIVGWLMEFGKRWFHRLKRDKLGYISILAAVLFVPFVALVVDEGHPRKWSCLYEVATDSSAECDRVATAVWIAIPLSVVLGLWLAYDKGNEGSLHRVRHTIGILALLGLGIASIAGPNWWWLASGDSPNSESVQHMALGTAAVLTLLFVVWRERIASGKASFERYVEGVRMLGDASMVTRTAGVLIIRDLCENLAYRCKGFRVLESFVLQSTEGTLSAGVLREGMDVRSACDALGRLEMEYGLKRTRLPEKAGAQVPTDSEESNQACSGPDSAE